MLDVEQLTGQSLRLVVTDRDGIVASVAESPIESETEPVGGVAISNLDGFQDTLIVSIGTSVCDATSTVSIERDVDGQVVLSVEPTSEPCDALAARFTLQVDLTEPVAAESVIRRSSTIDAYLWGMLIGADHIPMDVTDETRTTTAIRAVRVADGPPDPPGIVAFPTAVNAAQLTWTADPCEDRFQLLISSKSSYTQMQLRATAIEVDRCGAKRVTHAVVLSFADAHPLRLEPILVHGR